MPGRTPSWYADPDDPALARWHDGTGWTDFTMVIAEWTGSGPPPPPEGWSPAPSPTEGLVPAFGAAAPRAPVPPVVDEPTPAPDAPAVAPPAGEAPSPPPGDEPAGPDTAGDAGSGDEPRGLARLTGGQPATRAFGDDPAPPAEQAPPAEEQEPPSGPPTFADVPAPSGVRIDAPTAGPDPDEEVEEPISGSVAAIGPEAPGIDWGEGPAALKPRTRPSGWHLDEDGEWTEDVPELHKRGLLARYGRAPLWVRVAAPLVVIGLIALAVTSLAGGSDDDGDPGSRLFSQRDGTLDEATLDEPGMDDALTKARENGVPPDISDKELGTLVKGVCTAARRTLVSLNLSQSLADTGLEPAELGEAATAIANGALEYCPDQEAALGQVVSVLVTRTQRLLATSTTAAA